MNKFKNTDTNKRYHTYNYYTRKHFGGKVIKIPLDGGFTCPNIDGSRGVGGCSYCTKESLPYRGKTIREQFEEARKPLLKKWGREGQKELYIPYFQVFTNTYAPTEQLKKLYYEAMSLPGAVGLSIATRADCLSDGTIELLREISQKTYLTVELGLQTIHEKTAERINRGHTFEEFLSGYEKLGGINTCVHLINGLPGESRDMMLETARSVASLNPHSLKIHMLYLEKGTRLADEYLENPFHILTLEEYVSVTVSQLELFSPDTVIGRLTGDGESEKLIEPTWSRKKFCVLNEIDKEFKKRGTYQGIYYKNGENLGTNDSTEL